jgi:hypothetical protein
LSFIENLGTTTVLWGSDFLFLILKNLESTHNSMNPFSTKEGRKESFIYFQYVSLFYTIVRHFSFIERFGITMGV